MLLLAFAFRRLLGPQPMRPAPEAPPDWEAVRRIVRESPASYASLALLGDKRFLFGESGDTLLMYNTWGRSWVSMGDPIGPPEKWPELIWRFRDLADRSNGWTVFCQVGPAHLPLYVDLGLGLFKLGEEARVPLPGFSLEGSEMGRLRYTRRRLVREGHSFEVLPPEAVPAVLEELRAVSEDWLAGKNTREKGFSLGFFDERCLRQFPLAIVRGPRCRWFNLGMAPLAGIESGPAAPMWNRLAALIYTPGERFYNYQGLRRYKEKFAPVWTPRYLAAPGGLALPGILTGLASLISRGLGGIVAR